ncbi:hypothetical protein K438DRAFT_1871987 [Mycena galopus ATCC 62051]|nr:hypothetical protein K438DRAFT_1871987 [Mycena galopus ATCC 62051]
MDYSKPTTNDILDGAGFESHPLAKRRQRERQASSATNVKVVRDITSASPSAASRTSQSSSKALDTPLILRRYSRLFTRRMVHSILGSSRSTRNEPQCVQQSLPERVLAVCLGGDAVRVKCAGRWCLKRLRSTCMLWVFMRTGVIKHIWEEGMLAILPVATSGGSRRHGLGHAEQAPGARCGAW